MSYEEQLRQQHRERRARFAQAAVVPKWRPAPPPAPEPKPAPPSGEIDPYTIVSTTEPEPLRETATTAIWRAVLDRFPDVTRDEIVSPSRLATILWPRMILIYLMRTVAGHTFPKIGRALNRDHSTAINSYQRIADLIVHDSAVATEIGLLHQMIGKDIVAAGKWK